MTIPPDQLKSFLTSALQSIKTIAYIEDIDISREEAASMLRALGGAAMKSGIPDEARLEEAIDCLIEVMLDAKF